MLERDSARVIDVPQRSLADDEDTPVWVQIGASFWFLLIVLILYKRKANERARERMARRWLDPTDSKEWRLDPTRRKVVIEMITTSKRGNRDDSTNQSIAVLDMEKDGDSKGESQLKDMSDDASSSCCPVCLDTLESNDAISWSKMFRCEHVFHTLCLTPWLMKNDDCPVCRTILIQNEDYKYLNIEDKPNERCEHK